MKKLRWRVRWKTPGKNGKGVEKTSRHFSDAYKLAETLRSAGMQAEIQTLEGDT